MTDNPLPEIMEAPPKRSLIRRLGCGFALVLWALLLLSPCILITLAVRGEITFDTGSAPEQRFRMWLIMEPRERGIGISNGWIAHNENSMCVQTDVRFFLWQGAAESVSFCNCYDDRETPQLQESLMGVCAIGG